MSGNHFAQGSFGRRLITRAIVVLGAVLVGGQVMRALPHDQTLIFPVGSAFPDAKQFTASWQAPGSHEPSGGVTLSFKDPPPLQIRQHARLPNGDYIVTITVVGAANARSRANPETDTENSQGSSELKTTVERRVNLTGGETLIALAASASVLQ